VAAGVMLFEVVRQRGGNRGSARESKSKAPQMNSDEHR
jgi:hypothetical protein